MAILRFTEGDLQRENSGHCSVSSPHWTVAPTELATILPMDMQKLSSDSRRMLMPTFESRGDKLHYHVMSFAEQKADFDRA